MREKQISKFKHLPKFVIVSVLMLLLTIGILPLGFRAEAATHSHEICKGSDCKDTSHGTVTWTAYSKNFTYTNNVAYIYLSKNESATLTVDSGNTLYLCLNGNTLTGTITVNGTLHICDCMGMGTGKVVYTKGSVVRIGSEGELNYYSGAFEGGSGEINVPIYADGIVKLYAMPQITTSCPCEIRGYSEGFLHICKTLTKPKPPLRVNFGKGNDDVSMTKKTQVTVTTDWGAKMGTADPTLYFAPRTGRQAKIQVDTDQVVLRRLRISFSNNSSISSVDYASYNSGKLNSLPSTPTRTGYTFNGWFTAESGGTEITTSTVFEDDTTVYARWTANTYNVSFDINYTGGTNPTCQTVTYGSTYGTLPNPTRSGYSFEGWYTAKNGGALIDNNTLVSTAADHILYAHWELLEVVSVEITWGAMEFTYCDGDWNPDSHTYENGYRKADETDGNVITVQNKGNVAVSVTFGYTKSDAAVSAEFRTGETAVTAPVALSAGGTKKVQLILSGKPGGKMSKAVLGTVTVKLG